MSSTNRGSWRAGLLPLLLLPLGAPVPGAAAAPPAAVTDEDGAATEDESMEELKARLQAMEEKLRELQSRLEERPEADDAELARQLTELQRQVGILTEELERKKVGAAFGGGVGESYWGLGPAASKVYGIEKGVSLGGYGEMLYNRFSSTTDDGAPAEETDQLDFLRAVLYFGYKFNDRILFNSEIEFEHASTEDAGAVSVEFAYLDFLFREEINVRAGLLLLPVGFLNELHEPPIFLGARRPDVETEILPTTWRENGAGVFGDLGPVSFRAYIVSGLDSAGFTAARGIRGGRQDGSEAKAEDFAVVARFDWTIVPGVLVGGSVYSGGSAQGATTMSGDPYSARTTIYDLHAQWKWRGLMVRGLWTRIRIADVAEINDTNGFTGDESVGERLFGWYLLAGYDVLARCEKTDQALIPFVRYERYNTQDQVPDGFLANPANDVKLLTVGIDYKPIPQAVIKLEYQNYDRADGSGVDQVNIALGYLF